ncbi:MAG TPA: DUF5691 domain-containing protein [Nocardioidaceae bacterium]|nr:DUF5691 domain-containing protein [Nocardioidaceae bacterium]
MSTPDLDLWWRRLGSAALVGTARRPAPSLAELELGGGSALRPRAGARPEDAALDAAALGGALRRAGRLASTQAPSPAAAAPELLPEAPVRAAQLLELLLTQPPTDNTGTEELLLHWAATCRQAGYHVPHRLLPALLDRATSKELRSQVSVVAGERGAWLAPQNPAWSWFEESRRLHEATHAIEEAHDPDRWALMGTDERVSQLRRVRKGDPAAGRDLLLTTWNTDPAKDRRVLLEALLVNLGPGDEDFLEGALDDRAASVRELAAHLLDGLPGSNRAARMAERLSPLLGETGLLRRHLEVRLPDDPDAAGRRDGLGKPPPGRSARGWWLERIVAGAPFDAWGAPPEKVVPRLKDDDVMAGLRRAASVRRAPDWARALLDLGLEPDLLAVLPEDERESRVLDNLARAPHTSIPALLASLPPPWSPRLSAAVVTRLAGLKPEQTGPLLEVLMPQLVRGLHPDAVPALQRWRAKAQLPRRHDAKLGSLIQSRTLRQTISEAFQS